MPPSTETTTRPAVVAAFDVDGTLTTRDCVLPFLVRAAGWKLVTALGSRPLALARAALGRDRDRLKALACAALAGLAADEAEAVGASFAREVAARRLRADTTARLRRHRELGHTVILASASLDPYLVPLGELLGVDAVLCTRLERGTDGKLTGRLDGPNCRGAEKARRVRQWLDEAGAAGALLWAYGDSGGDDELLAMADHARRVDGVRLDADPA